jgi:hypothetical protein
MTRSSTPALHFRTSFGTVGEETVDSWELKASRRALMNLKTLLRGQPMRDLLSEQIAAADRYYASLLASSGGKLRECRVDISVEGLSAAAFLQWFAGAIVMDPEVAAVIRVFPAHPEHYTTPAPPQLGIVEMIGDHIARVHMALVDPATLPPSVTELADETYPLKMGFTCTLEDGTAFAYLLNEFRDNAGGCDIILRVMFPAAAPDALVDGHSEHFCIEFGHWLRAASADVAEAADRQS